MIQELEWAAGEYGRPLEGILKSGGKPIVIPDGYTVKLSAVRLDTNERVIDAVLSTIVDGPTGHVQHFFRDPDLVDDRIGVVMRCQFAVVGSDNKPVYVPDQECDAIHVRIVARVAA